MVGGGLSTGREWILCKIHRRDGRVKCPSRLNKINDRAGSLVSAGDDDRSRDGRTPIRFARSFAHAIHVIFSCAEKTRMIMLWRCRALLLRALASPPCKAIFVRRSTIHVGQLFIYFFFGVSQTESRRLWKFRWHARNRLQINREIEKKKKNYFTTPFVFDYVWPTIMSIYWVYGLTDADKLSCFKRYEIGLASRYEMVFVLLSRINSRF